MITRTTWADARRATVLDDSVEAIAALQRRGYVPPVRGDPFSVHLVRSLTTVADPALPEGFTLRTVTDADVESRVAMVHPGPKLLYESIGFRVHARTLNFRRSA